MLEEIAEDLCHRTQNPDPVYTAMAARFRLEMEECKVRLTPLRVNPSGVNLTPISLYIAPKLCIDYLSIA